jgi:hypothetical protein
MAAPQQVQGTKFVNMISSLLKNNKSQGRSFNKSRNMATATNIIHKTKHTCNFKIFKSASIRFIFVSESVVLPANVFFKKKNTGILLKLTCQMKRRTKKFNYFFIFNQAPSTPRLDIPYFSGMVQSLTSKNPYGL